MKKIIKVQSLNEYFGIAVTTTTGKVIQFGKAQRQVTLDSVIMQTWVNYFDNCISVDFLKQETVGEEGISSIWIAMTGKYDPSQMAVEVVPLDRGLFTDRTLKSTKLYYNGPNIVMEKGVPYGTYDDYILELNQDRYVENDPSKNCKNYPYQKYNNYNDCDKNFTLRRGSEILL